MASGEAVVRERFWMSKSMLLLVALQLLGEFTGVMKIRRNVHVSAYVARIREIEHATFTPLIKGVTHQ